MYNYFKNMVEQRITQEFRFQNEDKKRNYFVEEIEQNKLMRSTKSFAQH